MQPGYDDNHTDETLLEDMFMKNMLKVMQDSVPISQYLCIVALVVLVWIYTLRSTFNKNSLALASRCKPSRFRFHNPSVNRRDALPQTSFELCPKRFFLHDRIVRVGSDIPTLTRSISSDSIWAVTISLLLHDYSGSTIRPSGALKNPNLTSCISFNASIVASVFIASRLPSRVHVLATMLFSVLIFLFAPLVA